MLARFITEKLGAKTAGVLYDVASEAPKSQAELFRTTFEELGGSVVAFETYTTGDRDFSAQLTKIKSVNPDVVFLPAYYNDVGLIAQQARRQGIDQPLVGSDAWSSPELIKLSEGAVEGAYFANHYAADIATPAAKKFIGAYQAEVRQCAGRRRGPDLRLVRAAVRGAAQCVGAGTPGGARRDGHRFRLHRGHGRHPVHARARATRSRAR